MWDGHMRFASTSCPSFHLSSLHFDQILKTMWQIQSKSKQFSSSNLSAQPPRVTTAKTLTNFCLRSTISLSYPPVQNRNHSPAASLPAFSESWLKNRSLIPTNCIEFDQFPFFFLYSLCCTIRCVCVYVVMVMRLVVSSCEILWPVFHHGKRGACNKCEATKKRSIFGASKSSPVVMFCVFFLRSQSQSVMCARCVQFGRIHLAECWLCPLNFMTV